MNDDIFRAIGFALIVLACITGVVAVTAGVWGFWILAGLLGTFGLLALWE